MHMLSIRIQSMLLGYKRKVSNTELFVQDLAKIDKFISILHERKDFYKVRNKFFEVLEIFELDCIDEYILDYYSDVLSEDSMEMYYLVNTEFRNRSKTSKGEING